MEKKGFRLFGMDWKYFAIFAAIVLITLYVPIAITGSVSGGTANYRGVRSTALIAAGFIAAALVCYAFYRDKMITGAIDAYNAGISEDARASSGRDQADRA